MDFKGAVQTHVQWKMKLAGDLRKPDGSLNPASIEPDTQCTLGKWIHGEGTAFAARPEFAALKQAHAKFHRAAAVVVCKADNGQAVAEEIAIGAKSEFGSASSEVVTLLARLELKEVTHQAG